MRDQSQNTLDGGALILQFGATLNTPNPGIDPAPQSQISSQRAKALADLTKLPQPELVADLVAAHFDEVYYLREYPDVKGDRSELVRHFIQHGWYEGRNPNAFFDATSYLTDNGDVDEALVNPFVHYLTFGRREGRKITSSISPSIRTQLLFGHEVTDWVERLRQFVDVKYYERQLSEKRPAETDPVAHFAYRGWREGKCPSLKIEIKEWLAKYTASSHYIINPIIIHIEEQQKTTTNLIVRTRSTTAKVELVASADEISSEPIVTSKEDGFTAEEAKLKLIEPAFNAQFYLATYPDIVEAGVDPLTHFYYTGWREGRCPNEDFDTNYYLQVNEDVKAAGINPFWHYLVGGKAEGRLPRRPGGYRREIIDAAMDPSLIVYQDTVAQEKYLTADNLKKAIKSCCKAPEGLVVSVSHDCYVREIGGTQIFIADEQRRFNKRHHDYVHLSPAISRLVMVETKDPKFSVRVVANGKLLGVVRIASLIDLLRRELLTAGRQSRFIVHCLFGYHLPDVIELYRALKPKQSYYWLHDYSSLCPGFNLLRNNVEFCGAPPAGSMACRVCIYGKSRSMHLERMAHLFKECNFDVVGPSEFALNLWRKSSSLRRGRELVHPHWRAIELKTKTKRSDQRTSAKIRLAFVGFPQAHKGWPIFKELFRRFGKDDRYEFYHFAAKKSPTLPGINFVITEVTARKRNAAARLLAEKSIDFVLQLSTWPETFSFVAHEAISAGARILCLDSSGNVAELVKQLRCGEVFCSPEELFKYLEGPLRPIDALIKYKIRNVGTSATIEDATNIGPPA
jgi:hypothetical protein